MSPRYVRMCGQCKKEWLADIDDAARTQLRYALVNNLLEADDEKDTPNVEYKDTSANEPEGVKALRKLMEGDDDGAVAMRIWFDFRYALKNAQMTGKQFAWEDIISLIDAAIKRTRKGIKSAETRNQIIGRFIVMRKRCEEFQANPEADMAQICPEHQLPKFICPCPKE